MSDQLETLSVEQLNKAVNLINTSLQYGEFVQKSSTRPVTVQLTNPQTNVNTTTTAKSNIRTTSSISTTGNYMTVLSGDKHVILGQPVHAVQNLLGIGTSGITSTQMSSGVTSSSSCLQPQSFQIQNTSQPQPVQIQNATQVLQQNNSLPQVLQTSVLNNNIVDSLAPTVTMPSSSANLILSPNGTLQLTNLVSNPVQNLHALLQGHASVANNLLSNQKVSGIADTVSTALNTPKVSQQKPLLIASSGVFNNNNGQSLPITFIGEQVLQDSSLSKQFVLEILPAQTMQTASSSVASVLQTVSSTSASGQNSIPQTLSSFNPQSTSVLTQLNTKPTVTSLKKTPASAMNLISAAITPSLSTILLKKTEHACHSGAVLEMVEKLPQVKHDRPEPYEQENIEVDQNEYQVIDYHGVAHGIYCVECDKMYSGENAECSSHSYLVVDIADTPVLSRARMSLPSQLQVVTESLPHIPQVGIFTRKTVQKQSRFGPLIGELHDIQDIVNEQDMPKLWKIFEDGECKKAYDCNKEENSNWMSLVRRAKSNEEQNVVAYQQGQQIWFITHRDIPPNTELLYWFSTDYAKLLGMPLKPSNCFKCGFCHKIFQELGKVRSHIAYCHSGSGPGRHKCQICSKSFPGMAKLQTHIMTHLGLKPFSCQTCGKAFSDQSNLRLHTAIHTGAKEFKCNQCGRTFRQKAHLLSHYLVHSGEKNHRCGFCDKLFARVSDLRSHEISVHTKSKSYTCTESSCQKVFHKLGIFKKHMLIHMNRKDFSCILCNKKFITKYHMTRHTKACKGTNKAKKTKDSKNSDTVTGDNSSTDSCNDVL